MSYNEIIDKMSLYNAFHQIGVLSKSKEVILKCGSKSDVYIDLRCLVSYPQFLKGVCEVLATKIDNKANIMIAGIPLGGVPFAIGISLDENIPCILIRDIIKDYGLKKQIEGVVDHNKSVVLVEDVITTGKSVCKVIEILEMEKIKINKVLCVVDREQGGVKAINNKGYEVESIFKLSDIN